jgi:ribulose-phosphate 3-epimerase
MIEIIPTILVKSFKEVKERIGKVENYVDWVQLDIMDGRFVDNTTWNSPKDLKDFKTRVKLEAHLMIERPEEKIDNWLETVDRVIIHYEACNNPKDLIEKVHSKEKQIGLAINPETSIDVVKPFLNDLDLVLIMTVNPGKGGQEFKDEVLSKIETLRRLWPNGNIEVDGGINNENIKKVVEAGANLICVGTYIFKSKDIKQAIESLKK